MVLDCVTSHYRPLEMNLVERLTGPDAAAAVTAVKLESGRLFRRCGRREIKHSLLF